MKKDSPMLYRPSILDEYIGQEKAKSIISHYLISCKERKTQFPHILIHGAPGLGKTTLALIIANLINQPCYIGIYLKPNWAWDIVRKKYSIMFIDEIHSIDRVATEELYTPMEDYLFDDRRIPFTLIGATTEIGDIIKDRKPFYDRFKIIIELENYNISELIKIAKNYQNKVYPDDILPEEIFEILAFNSRNTPRNLIRLIDATICYNSNYREVFSNFNIINNGYTKKDLMALNYISEQKNGVGLQSISAYLNISDETYLYEIEPYLLRNDLIVRGIKGRKVTPKGLETMEELNAIITSSI